MQDRARQPRLKKGTPNADSDVSELEAAEPVCRLDSWVWDRLKSVLPASRLRQESRSQTVALAVILSLLTVCLIAPFAGKAFHVDDPLYLWTAKHILKSPLNFYGYDVNWYGTEEPMSRVMKNPPLASYYLALVGSLFGWGEVVIHLAMIVPAILTVLGVFFLARSLCRSPFEATLISLVTPVFLVSANTAMCDVLMLSFWVWAILLWMTGLEKNKHSYLAISAIFMAAAALSKYPGVALIPLLFAYSLLKKRRPGMWILYYAIPILALGGYQWYTQGLYGKGLLTAAADYPDVPRLEGYTKAARGVIGLGFAGGCLASSFFYGPFLWRRRYLLLGTIALLVMMIVMPQFDTIGGFPMRDMAGLRWGIVVQFCLFVFAGLQILALAATDLWNRRDANSALLLMWILGVYVFASFVNWTINARSVLSMLPAVGILVARRLESRDPLRSGKWNPAWALIPSLVLALLVTFSDYRLANCARQAADLIGRKYAQAGRTLWYDGHWGFQYYMDLRGTRHLSANERFSAGEMIVIPENAPLTYDCRPPEYVLLDTINLSPMAGLTTIRGASAGFYSDATGPLPFAFGPVEPEQYKVWTHRP
jgi:4-amino-4-deoxy-L-arabinose transferase-like glycosyltransferase